MAIIGKIREKTTFLFIVIGLTMLAFILGDKLTNSGSDQGPVNIGEIKGKEISGQEFEAMVQKSITEYETQGPVNEALKEQIREQEWNRLLEELIFGAEYSELGLSVGKAELFDLIQGNDPHALIRRNFTDPTTGQLNRMALISSLKKANEGDDEEFTGKWVQLEKIIKKDRFRTKYLNLISKGIYITKAEAERDFIEKNERLSIQYVAKRYTDINDDEVSYDENDIEKYYDEHKDEYQQEASRKMSFVVFDVVPSEGDVKEIEGWVNEMFAEFKQTENDSAFINYNSDTEFDFAFYKKEELIDGLDSSLFDASIGTMVGPYFVDDTYKIAKLTRSKIVPDSVHARHILIPARTETEIPGAISKIDSIRKLIKGGRDFAELAKLLSADSVSGRKGGDLEWFSEGRMVPEFNQFCFNGKKGDLDTVKTVFGYHLVQILDQSQKVKKVQIAVLDRKLEPSDNTFDKVFNEATNFSLENSSMAAFKESSAKNNYLVRMAEVKETDKNIPGLESARSLIRWVYENEEGSVSEPFEMGRKYVVVCLTDVREDGIADLDKVRPEIELEVIKLKKAEKVAGQIDGIADLQEIAQKLGTIVESRNNVLFSSFSIPGVGNEPALLGRIFSMNINELSEAISGNTGVFVVRLTDKVPAPEASDFSMNKLSLERNIESRIYNQAFEALKEKADVVDDRLKYY